MKNVLLVICAGVLFSACKKDKFTTTPQIKFVDISPNYFSSEFNTSLYKESAPKLIIKVTDAEGDFGSVDITDSSMIYIKNLLSNSLDSTEFPDLTRAPKKDFSAEVSINLFDYLECISPGPPTPRIDTTFFEVYIVDAKKNKSNVITTPRPVYYECK